jgi:hypothetical protein
MKQPKDFFKTKAYQDMMARWRGKDMEQYFIDKSKAHLEQLQKDIKKK